MSRLSAPARALVTGAVVLVVALTGCTGLPRSGPVVDADVPSSVDDDLASDINAVPPKKGGSRLEIAQGFLDVMTASPIRVDVAKQYLTEAAASEWNPGVTITYASKLPPREVGTGITISLADAELIDSSGAYQGKLSHRQQQLRFDLTIEHGEYRISNPRNALIVPAPWFAQRYRQVSLYFFDRGGQILVPEPVFVPRGEQLVSTLVTGLLAGPGEELDRIARTFIPPRLSIGLSAPISPDGVVDIDLQGDVGSLTAATTERMFAQLAWTLRQEPEVTALRVSIGGEEVRAPGGGTDYAVADAVTFDPTGYDASPRLFGLQNGLLSVASGAELQPLSGPFSTRRYGLRSVALDLSATQAAGVTADGTTVLTAPAMSSVVSEGKPVHRAFRNGTDLLEPAWDFTGRLWLVDRTANGAVVRYVEGNRTRKVQVPGVSKRTVTSFLISRDATRFVAVVRGRDADQLRIGRIEVDDRGRVARSTPTVVLADDQSDQVRIKDIAWTSPTTIAVLSPVSDGVFEVRALSVDGSPTNAETLSTTVSGEVLGLAAGPAPGLTQYAVTRTGLVDLATGVSLTFPAGGVPTIDYVG